MLFYCSGDFDDTGRATANATRCYVMSFCLAVIVVAPKSHFVYSGLKSARSVPYDADDKDFAVNR